MEHQGPDVRFPEEKIIKGTESSPEEKYTIKKDPLNRVQQGMDQQEKAQDAWVASIAFFIWMKNEQTKILQSFPNLPDSSILKIIMSRWEVMSVETKQQSLNLEYILPAKVGIPETVRKRLVQEHNWAESSLISSTESFDISGTIEFTFLPKVECRISGKQKEINGQSVVQVRVDVQSERPASHTATTDALQIINRCLQEIGEATPSSLLCKRCLDECEEPNQGQSGTFDLARPLRRGAKCSKGHKIKPWEVQMLSPISRDFELFQCPPNTQKPILRDSLVITCKDKGVTVKARVANFEDFDKITNDIAVDNKWDIISPILEVELVNPKDDVLPEDITVGIRHFLTVPNSPEIKAQMEKRAHQHHFLKIIKHEDTFKMEVIDSFSDIQSDYFSTMNLAKQPLCFITSASVPECAHSLVKNIVFTKKMDLCPHQPSTIGIYCVCEASQEAFCREISENSESMVSKWRYRIENTGDIKHQIFPSTIHPINDQSVRPFEISHIEL